MFIIMVWVIMISFPGKSYVEFPELKWTSPARFQVANEIVLFCHMTFAVYKIRKRLSFPHFIYSEGLCEVQKMH